MERIDRPISKEVTIINNTNKPTRIQIDLQIDEDYKDYDLSKYIKVYPKVISLPAKGRRVVRFRVTPTKGMLDGEYKTYMYFKELPKERTKADILKESNTIDDGKIGVNLSFLTNMGISIYGRKGELIQGIEILESKITEDKNKIKSLDIPIRTSGNSGARIECDIEYLDKDNKVLDKMKSINIGLAKRDKTTVKKYEILDYPEETKFLKVLYKNRETENVIDERIYEL